MSNESIDEAMLFAYVDGELDAAQRVRVEEAVARDPRLAAMLTRQQQLQSQLRNRFDAVLDEVVPDRLLRAAAAPASAQVVDLRAARDSRVARAASRWTWREWGAVAATLVLGLLVGSNLPRGAGDATLVAQTDGLKAAGPLAAALTDRPAGPVDAATSIGFSIRTASGEYCRSFSLQSGAAGLACRRGDRWMVDVLESDRSGSLPGSFRQAGSTMPEGLRNAIEGRMVGEPLTEAEELEQIAQRWEGQSQSGPGR